MTRRRSERTVLGAVGRLDQLLQRVVPALEDRGGEERDLFDLVSRIPQGEHWLAMAILERLGVYQVSLPSGNFLARLLERADIRLNLDRLPSQLQSSVTISAIQGAASLEEDEMTLEFPLLCEAYDGRGNPMVARVTFLNYWKRKGRLPATVEQVLELLIDDRDLPIWEDRILIFGSECLLGEKEKVRAFLQLSPTGQLEPLPEDHSLYLNKPGVRVAFVREPVE